MASDQDYTRLLNKIKRQNGGPASRKVSFRESPLNEVFESIMEEHPDMVPPSGTFVPKGGLRKDDPNFGNFRALGEAFRYTIPPDARESTNIEDRRYDHPSMPTSSFGVYNGPMMGGQLDIRPTPPSPTAGVQGMSGTPSGPSVTRSPWTANVASAVPPFETQVVPLQRAAGGDASTEDAPSQDASALNWMSSGTIGQSDPSQLGMDWRPAYHDDLPERERAQNPKDRALSSLIYSSPVGSMLPYLRAGEEARLRGEDPYQWLPWKTQTPAFEKQRKALQQYYNDAYEAAPDEIKVLGGVGLPGGPMHLMGQYLTSASRPIASAAGVGAAQAGLAGYLSPVDPATADWKERLQSAAESAQTGAITGGLLGAGAKGARHTFYNEDGTPKTAAEVYATFKPKPSGAAPEAPTAPRADEAPTNAFFADNRWLQDLPPEWFSTRHEKFSSEAPRPKEIADAAMTGWEPKQEPYTPKQQLADAINNQAKQPVERTSTPDVDQWEKLLAEVRQAIEQEEGLVPKAKEAQPKQADVSLPPPAKAKYIVFDPKTGENLFQYATEEGARQHIQQNPGLDYERINVPAENQPLKAGAQSQPQSAEQPKIPAPSWADKDLWEKAPQTAAEWERLLGGSNDLVDNLSAIENWEKTGNSPMTPQELADSKILNQHLLLEKYGQALNDWHQNQASAKPNDFVVVNGDGLEVGHYATEAEAKAHASQDPDFDYFRASDKYSPPSNTGGQPQYKPYVVTDNNGLEIGHYATEAEAKAHASKSGSFNYFGPLNESPPAPAQNIDFTPKDEYGQRNFNPSAAWPRGKPWSHKDATENQKVAISGYTDGEYDRINRYFRGAEKELPKYAQDTARYLDEITRHASFNEPIKRDVPAVVRKLMRDNNYLEPGAEFPDAGFGSFSRDLNYTHPGNGPEAGGLTIMVDNPGKRFAYIDPHSEFSRSRGNEDGEDEVIAARNTHYRVKSWDQQTGVLHVDVIRPHEVPSLAGLTEGKLERLPLSKMREYSEAEFPWEYREYEKYASHIFPGAFKDAADFKKKYEAAPLAHLTDKQLKNLDYSTASGYMDASHEAVDRAHEDFGHRRDTGRIEDDLLNGQSAPPIVLKHRGGLRILGGNTRLSMAAAHGYNMPVKIIDITK